IVFWRSGLAIMLHIVGIIFEIIFLQLSSPEHLHPVNNIHCRGSSRFIGEEYGDSRRVYLRFVGPRNQSYKIHAQLFFSFTSLTEYLLYRFHEIAIRKEFVFAENLIKNL